MSNPVCFISVDVCYNLNLFFFAPCITEHSSCHSDTDRLPGSSMVIFPFSAALHVGLAADIIKYGQECGMLLHMLR